MELFEERDNFIIKNGEYSLWCNRFDGSMKPRNGSAVCGAWNPICLGIVYGVIGKYKVTPDTEWRLLLIKQCSSVGFLPNGEEVFKINKIAILPLILEGPKDFELERCDKHHFGISKNQQITKIPDNKGGLQKTWNSIKSAAENVKPKKKEYKDRERTERRVLEEINRMFNDSDSFYFSPKGDLTNSIQRQNSGTTVGGAPWRRADSRFFWNKYMMQDLITDNSSLADPWIIPVMQGYVQIEDCHLDLREAETCRTPSPIPSPMEPIPFKLYIISRRSRYCAGTRYKKRGVDSDGNTANYVETEQILEFSRHVTSFVQIRGSVPLFWSQTGYKYKPPPKIEKGEAENQDAFNRHFEQETARYEHVNIINLVDQSGNEQVIAENYLKHVQLLNSPLLTYVAFDFHEYCRGIEFYNISILIENIIDIIKQMRYCWVDSNGVICSQQGIFRVNCIDCLDRTNVVQLSISKVILEIMCRKLGLLPPDTEIPLSIRQIYQQMWANNGDTISRQYAGTDALKGDFTRTGERSLGGMMKDGYNSASRYYLNRFKDPSRQRTIDLLLGKMTDFSSFDVADGEADDYELLEKEENLKNLIDECKKMLITEPETCLGGWGLIDSDPSTGDPTQQDMDIILLLSQRAYYVASYDDDMDQITSYQKIFLEDLDRIEIGAVPSFFKSKHLVIRLYYHDERCDEFFHSFRTTSTRLFNNIIIPITNQEEVRESLKAISESFSAAQKLMGLDLPISEGTLEKQKSRAHNNVINIASQAQMNTWSHPLPLSRDNSFSNLRNVLQVKKASLEASKLGRTFAGLNPMKRVKFARPKGFMNASFIPAVLYSKDSEKAASSSLERAKILKGQTIAPSSTSSQEYIVPKFTVMDCDTSEQYENPTDVEIEAELQMGDVMLESCGILATQPTQLINQLMQEKKSVSVDALSLLRRNSSKVRPGRSRLVRKRDHLAAHLRTRSLDIEEISELRKRGIKPENEQYVFTPIGSDSKNSASPVNDESQKVRFSLDHTNVIPAFSEEQNTPDVADVEANIIYVPDDDDDDDDDNFVHVDVPVPAPRSCNSSKQNAHDSDPNSNSETERKKPIPAPRPSKRNIPRIGEVQTSMKMSFSDGSIAYHNDADEIILQTSGISKAATGSTPAMAKLKVKMSNLSLPSMANQQRHQVLQQSAATKKEESLSKYSNLASKIILL